MKKIISLLAVTLSFYLPGFSQYTLHTIFPMGVIGYSSADDLLNKREILQREGIKKITAYQTVPEMPKTFTSKTVYLNTNGNMDAITICFSNRTGTDSGFCVTDSLFYDHLGRLREYRSHDIKGVTLQSISEYKSDREVKSTTITRLNPDTLTEYKYFNEKGQMVRVKQLTNGVEKGNASLYYNKDGLTDSIKYENSPLATSIFKRTEKRKSKSIETENTLAKFKWIYNLSGQCIATIIAVKNQTYLSTRSGDKYSSKTEINYYYNTNGTLSKVTQKTGRMPKYSMIYSYSK
jgi:hypothetical protein